MLGDKFYSGMKLLRGTGCAFCNNSGYAGRSAVHEIMKVDDTVRMLIAKGEGDLKLKRFFALKRHENIAGRLPGKSSGRNDDGAGSVAGIEWRL